MEIGEFFDKHDVQSTIDRYPSIFNHISYTNECQKLHRWRKDVIMQRTIKPIGNIPEYGKVIDDELLKLVQDHLARGLLVSDKFLRLMLVNLLEHNGKQHLLREYGGKNTYGSSWVNRFLKRQKLPFRRIKNSHRTSDMYDGTIRSLNMYNNLVR